jgi:RHS repeat-associated protein
VLQLAWDDANRLACSSDGKSTPSTIAVVATTSSFCDTSDGHSVRYRYDDQGNRVIKDGGPHDVNIYPNQDYTQQNQAAFKHIFIGNTRLVSKLVEPSSYPENNQFYFHADQLGSTGYGTDNTGRVVDHQQYFPSGESWVDEHNVTPNPYRFTGKELDAETGLYYYGARYYDPKTAVWQSPDPAVGSYLNGSDNGGVFNPVNLATYTYGADNPVRRVDTDGRGWVDIDQTKLEEIGHVAKLFGMEEFKNVPDNQTNQTLGTIFARAALRSLSAKIELRSEVSGSPDADQRFLSRMRDALTFMNKKHQVDVVPDGVGPVNIVDRRTGAVLRYNVPDSLYVEVKTGKEPIGPETENWQIWGMIYVAAATSGVRMPDVIALGAVPVFVIVSTQDVKPTTGAVAETGGVALFGARLQWDEGGLFSTPTVRVGPIEPLNATARASGFVANDGPALGAPVPFFP